MKQKIKNIPKSYDKNEYIFHAGLQIDGKVFTNGGRVLNSTVSLPSDEGLKRQSDRTIKSSCLGK